MIDTYVLLTPLLMLPVVALLCFVGCDWVLGLDRPDPDVPVLEGTAGDGRVELTWQPDERAGEFRIYRGETPGVHEPIETNEDSKPSHIDYEVTNGTPYYYVVTAVGDDGETDPSNEVMVTPAAGILTSFISAPPVVAGTVSVNGSFGMSITVGANPLTVKSLGRAFAPGNTQLHVVRIAEALSGIDVPNAAVAVTMAGGTVGQFKYAPLAIPVTLDPGVEYFIVSQETSPGDRIFNHTVTIETTTVATVNGSVRPTPPDLFVDAPGVISYGPVDFQY